MTEEYKEYIFNKVDESINELRSNSIDSINKCRNAAATEEVLKLLSHEDPKNLSPKAISCLKSAAEAFELLGLDISAIRNNVMWVLAGDWKKHKESLFVSKEVSWGNNSEEQK